MLYEEPWGPPGLPRSKDRRIGRSLEGRTDRGTYGESSQHVGCRSVVTEAPSGQQRGVMARDGADRNSVVRDSFPPLLAMGENVGECGQIDEE